MTCVHANPIESLVVISPPAPPLLLPSGDRSIADTCEFLIIAIIYDRAQAARLLILASVPSLKRDFPPTLQAELESRKRERGRDRQVEKERNTTDPRLGLKPAVRVTHGRLIAD